MFLSLGFEVALAQALHFLVSNLVRYPQILTYFLSPGFPVCCLPLRQASSFSGSPLPQAFTFSLPTSLPDTPHDSFFHSCSLVSVSFSITCGKAPPNLSGFRCHLHRDMPLYLQLCDRVIFRVARNRNHLSLVTKEGELTRE